MAPADLEADRDLPISDASKTKSTGAQESKRLHFRFCRTFGLYIVRPRAAVFLRLLAEFHAECAVGFLFRFFLFCHGILLVELRLSEF